MTEQTTDEKEKHSMTWLELLPMEINQVNELFIPEAELDTKEDNMVGMATEEQKRLFTLYRTAGQEIDRRMLEYKYFRGSDEEKEKFRTSLTELRRKHDTLGDIFWITLNDYFNLWDKDCIGVRSGWEVVWGVEKDSPLPPGLRHLFGER